MDIAIFDDHSDVKFTG